MDRIQFLGFLQVEEKASEAVMTVVAKQLAAWFSPPSAKVEENEEGQEYLSTSEPWLTDSCLHPYHLGSHGIPKKNRLGNSKFLIWHRGCEIRGVQVLH